MSPEADSLKGNVSHVGFLGGPTGKESASQCRKAERFDPWVKKISWRRKWQPTPICMPGRLTNDRKKKGGYCQMLSKEVPSFQQRDDNENDDENFND